MKRLIVILSFLVVFLSGYGQKEVTLHYQKVDEKPFHFGFTLGFNSMDFGIDPSQQPYGVDSTVLMPELNKLSPGFHVSIITSLKLSEYLDLRFLPGITLGQRNLLFYQEETPVSEMKIESTFIDLPLLIKYKSVRINNYRPYLIGGANVRFDLARNKDFDEDEGIYIKLKTFDVCYDMGFGIDFYTQNFKFSIEFKYSVGLFDVVSQESSEFEPQFANSINSLKSRLFMVSFHFE